MVFFFMELPKFRHFFPGRRRKEEKMIFLLKVGKLPEGDLFPQARVFEEIWLHPHILPSWLGSEWIDNCRIFSQESSFS